MAVFEQVDFIYQGDPNRMGGYRKIIATYSVRVFWTGSITREISDRYGNIPMDAEVTVMFDKQIPVPSPDNTLIKRNGITYKINRLGDDFLKENGFFTLSVSKYEGS